MSLPYTKINSLWKRDEKGKLIRPLEWANPLMEYLKDLPMEWTEKVDGTNIRITCVDGGAALQIQGRTDNAQIPPFLETRLNEIVARLKWKEVFPEGQVTLYGEGYGAKIQQGGGKYIPDGVDFVLFDVLVDNKWWLSRDNVMDVARQLGLQHECLIPFVPFHCIDSMWGMWQAMYESGDRGYFSTWGLFPMEGVVGRPLHDLFDRQGHRIMAKIKYRDIHEVDNTGESHG